MPGSEIFSSTSMPKPLEIRPIPTLPSMATSFGRTILSRALRTVSARDKIALPKNVAIDGSVGIGRIPTGFGIEVELKISLPGMDRAEAQALIYKAHVVCPYSNATRNNIDVKLTLV